MSDKLLFQPVRLGALTLRNRIVMAPMTRSRATDNLPNALMAEQYAQRADAGLIITEGTAPAADGLGYPRIPGVFTTAQAEGWRGVTDAVHAKGGQIVVQLMHTGRVGHPANLPAGGRVLAPSAVAAPGEMYTDAQGPQPHPVPDVMAEADIEAAIQGYADAAALAVEVGGFDGVEIHAANGYLADQFLNVASNQRTDRWGGSVENRARFVLAVAERVAGTIGADRTGIRVSPYGVFNGMTPDPEHDALYAHLAQKLGALGLAYIHVVDHSAMGAPPVPAEVKTAILKGFGPNYILSGGYDAARAEADLQAGLGAAVAFGRPFISNPDLVDKLARGAELRAPDMGTFYTPGPKGYTDYPVG